MRKSAIAMTGLALMAAAGAAQSADLGGMRPYAAPARAYSAYNWMGPYIGANVGYQWADATRSATEPSGGLFGGQAGYNWQSGALVVGVETDLQWSNADDVVFPNKVSSSWFGTTRGRVGYAMNNVLFYGTGGLAYGDVEFATGGFSQSRTSYGWALGIGAEVGLTPNWTARVEYLHYDLADRTFFNGTSHGLESNVLRAGGNYKF